MAQFDAKHENMHSIERFHFLFKKTIIMAEKLMYRKKANGENKAM